VPRTPAAIRARFAAVHIRSLDHGPPQTATPFSNGLLGVEARHQYLESCAPTWTPNMREDERVWAVRELLSDYVKSPSLRHIRDPHSLIKLGA
jgi:hypothetical protein